MKPKIAWKLFAAFFLVIVGSFITLYVILALRLDRFLVQETQKNLLQKALLIRDHVESLSPSEWNPETTYDLAHRMSEESQSRVTLIAPDGTVLGESDVGRENLGTIENHLDRPEIQEALRKEYGLSRRHSATVKIDFLYLALKTRKGFVRVALPLEIVKHSEDEIRRSILIALLVALAIASLAGLVLSRSAIRFLLRMSEAAQQIARGDLSVRLHGMTRDEIGDLGRAINSMAEGLDRQMAELKTEKTQLKTILDGMIEGVLVTNAGGEILQINPALQSMMCVPAECAGKTVLECLRNPSIHDAVKTVLRDGMPLEKEVEAWVDGEERNLIVHTGPLELPKGVRGSVSVFYDVTNLRKLEGIRKEFVANVSHELRTPLTCIRGFAETLRSGALEDRDAARRFVEKIESNAAQLQNLVEDLLDLSKIESGRLELDPQPCRVRSITESVLENFETLKAKRLSMENRIVPEIEVRVDPKAFRQILANLIDNAIKYTPEGGRIMVTSEIIGGLCRVTVTDTGIGIPKKDLPRVFERFYRTDKARSRQMGGTGLGLAIVKHLVQAHGGEVGVRSEVGNGSEFWFTVPL